MTFLGLNVPGGDNNRGRTLSEYAARNEADLEWIREGFDHPRPMGVAR